MDQDDFVGDRVFGRTASAPLSIHDHYDRSTPFLVWERSSLHASRLQAVHTHLGLLIEGSRPENLEHCKLSVYYAGPLLPMLFCGEDNHKLRSLYLDRLNFLPFNLFPALTLFSFSLCRSWSSKGGLVRFLTGSPKLKELYICRVDVGMHARLAANEPTRWQSVTLPELQRFAFDGHGELSIISAFRRISSTIIVSDTCDSYYTPVRTSGEDSIDALLSVLPGEKQFTRMRLDFSGRTLLQLVGARGSLSLSPTVTQTAHWKDLINLITSSPFFAHIKELSLCLDKHDYERIASLPPLLACFPKLRGLVVTPVMAADAAALLLGGRFRRLSPPGHTLHLLACLHWIFSSRPWFCRIEQLVVGYEPGIELEVLASVYSLERRVTEYALCKVEAPAWISSDWVLGAPQVFRRLMGVRADWPVWSESARRPRDICNKLREEGKIVRMDHLPVS
ncbi:hypothetical protein C8Q74DRAFT_1221331 [Fomes fomentarius]|nr:hypothetical protein C8Q74DRAFT_1221331 [Fomes fomentarius]